MTPAEHYREAEKFLRIAAVATLEEERTERYALAAAQVHATLATVPPRIADQAATTS